MKKYLILVFLFVVNIGIAQTPAFPSAYGAGAFASGGRGGNVYTVTSLADGSTSDVGTFRWALAQPRPATIIFDVSGIIWLNSWLSIGGSDLTIAGQTAPVGGITVSWNPSTRFRVRDGNTNSNMIFRYFRVRPVQSGNDALEIFNDTESSNIIFDHLSGSYGGDETFSIRGPETKNITFQRLLVAESKTGSLFGDSDVNQAGNSYDNSIHNCLYFNVSHRTPNVASDTRVDVINNVTHDWHYRPTYVQHGSQTNHINNYYSAGQRTSLTTGGGAYQVNSANSSMDHQIYTAGNIIDKGFFTDPNADNRIIWAEYNNGLQNLGQLPNSEFTSTQYPLLGRALPIQTATQAYNDVVNDVGANKSLNGDGTYTVNTDVQDAFYLGIMAQGEGAYHDYQMYDKVRSWVGEQMYIDYFNVTDTDNNNDGGDSLILYEDDTYTGPDTSVINSRAAGWDTDGDGIPDTYETLRGWNPNVANNNVVTHVDGYTQLEEYLNLVDEDNTVVVENVQSSGVMQTSLTISWDAVTNATSYDVFRDNVFQSNVTNGETYNDSGLTAGTSYSYRIDAKNYAGDVLGSSQSLSVQTQAAVTVGNGISKERLLILMN